MNSLSKIKDNGPSLLIGLFVSLEIISYFFIERRFFDLIFALLGLILMIFQFRYILENKLGIFIFFVLCFLFGLYINKFEYNIDSMVPFRLMVHFLFFIILVRYNVSPKVFKYIFYSYFLYVLFILLIIGLSIKNIFPAASENFAGWIGFVLGSSYYILLYQQKKNMEYYTAIMVVIFAIICVGRGTIAASLLLLIAVTMYRLGKLSFDLKYMLLVLTIIFATIIVAVPQISETFLSFFGKFQKKGLDLDSRDFIIFGYLNKISLQTFFMGVNPRQYPFTLLHENFHNSFLSLHSQFGILGLASLVYTIFLTIFNFIKKKFLSIILLAIFLRIFTDTIAFVGLFDFIIYYLIYCISVKNDSTNKDVLS